MLKLKVKCPLNIYCSFNILRTIYISHLMYSIEIVKCQSTSVVKKWHINTKVQERKAWTIHLYNDDKGSGSEVYNIVTSQCTTWETFFNVTSFILCIWNCRVQSTPRKLALRKFCNMNAQWLNLEVKQVNYFMAVATKESRANEFNNGIFIEFCCKVSLLMKKKYQFSGCSKEKFHF